MRKKKKMKKRLYDEPETVLQKCFAFVTILEKNENYGTHRRTGCEIWVHEDCSGWDSPDGYLCQICFKMA
jgi:hypothetical protein